jgi:hypothetical protein
MKAIRLTLHAQGYLGSRGFTLEEVEEVIRTTEWELNDRGRFESRKDFVYGQIWNGQMYEFKQVRPIFVEEADEIVSVGSGPSPSLGRSRLSSRSTRIIFEQ